MSGKSIGAAMLFLLSAALCYGPPVRFGDGESPFGRGERVDDTLTSKSLVLKCFTDWRTKPAAYQGAVVTLQRHRRFKVAAPGLPPDTVVVADPLDQTDPQVARALTGGIQIWTLGGERSFGLRSYRAATTDVLKMEPNVTVRDGVGEPMPLATVELVLIDKQYLEPEEQRVSVVLAGRRTDDKGRMFMPTVDGDFSLHAVRVAHVDYGAGQGQYRPGLHKDNVHLPLAKIGSVARERALNGVVVDPNGRPVSGATIYVSGARTPGEGLIQPLTEGLRVHTDEAGRFSIYLPNKDPRAERGKLIPPGTRYQVSVSPPAGSSLFPYAGGHSNDAEARIVMIRGSHFHTFAFEGREGPITDPEQLRHIHASVRLPDETATTLARLDWAKGERVPLGAYRAEYVYHDGSTLTRFEFDPVDVTAESPEQLVFRVPADVKFRGMAFRSDTVEPVKGAFVLGITALGSGRLSNLTDEEWRELRALPDPPPLDAPALQPVRRAYGFDDIARTDENGCYEMTRKADPSFYSFMVFDKDFVPYIRRVETREIKGLPEVDVQYHMLCPAARVRLEVKTAPGQRVSALPHWIIDREENPSLPEALFTRYSSRSNGGYCRYDGWIAANKPQWVFVPAGVKLQLKLETPYDDKLCDRLIPQVINLKQGETLELGPQTFEPAIRVAVKVVDETGKTLEGIPVRRLQNGRAWTVAHNSDEVGLAYFHVPPHSKGQFGANHETVDYAIAGPEDANKEFVLTLSNKR